MLKVKVGKKDILSKLQLKERGVFILISEKIDFKSNIVVRDKNITY